MFKTKRILFWIDGPSPTRDERIYALSFGPGVTFRNGAIETPSEGAIEKCDAVTALHVALIPARYAKSYPVLANVQDLATLYEKDFADLRDAREAGEKAKELATVLAAPGSAVAAAEAAVDAGQGPKSTGPFPTTEAGKPPTPPASPVAWAPNS